MQLKVKNPQKTPVNSLYINYGNIIQIQLFIIDGLVLCEALRNSGDARSSSPVSCNVVEQQLVIERSNMTVS